ncbi:hypothetical protein J4Q44_G00246950 [Coregonus suidteri]|uniref:G protein-coupled receptor 137c n=1 Tax=Coregonus suidteri TaxID=861788 RepID=A0AAN8L8K4_9TELE
MDTSASATKSVLHFLCLLWSALRTTLFSFYFKNVVQRTSCSLCLTGFCTVFPVCLQFFTLCLLNLYFAQIMFKAKAKYSPELNKYKVLIRLAFIFASLFFLVVNLTCAMLVQGGIGGDVGKAEVRQVVLARVLVNDTLFVLCAILLAVCIFKIAKMSSANVYLESKGTSVCQATAIGAAVILLYTSRACYNLVVVALSPEDRPSPFNYSWYNVSDQADIEKISGEAYIIFGIILFFWELLPTSLVVVFFRVQRPNQNLDQWQGPTVPVWLGQVRSAIMWLDFCLAFWIQSAPTSTLHPQAALPRSRDGTSPPERRRKILVILVRIGARHVHEHVCMA